MRHFRYELPRELANDLRLRTIGDKERLAKSKNCISPLTLTDFCEEQK